MTDVAFLGRSAWLSIPEESRLLRVDLATRKVTKVVKLPWMPTDRIAAGGGLVWVREARNLGIEVLGIDARTGRIVRRFPIGGSSIGIAYGAGSLWLVGGGEVVRVDPRTRPDAPPLPGRADLLAVRGRRRLGGGRRRLRLEDRPGREHDHSAREAALVRSATWRSAAARSGSRSSARTRSTS